MKKFILLLFVIALLLVSPLPAFAQFGSWEEECYVEVDEVDGEKIATIKGFECIVRKILNIIIRVAGVLLFIMLLVSGFKYLTAGGDPKKAEAAQKTLTYAIGGLALVILAWFLLLFIEKFTGVTVTQFNIPTN